MSPTKISIVAAFLISLAFSTPATSVTVYCSPIANPGACTYAGCLICGPPPSVCQSRFITEAACAICDDVAEAAYFGSPRAGSGSCSSTTEASLCVGCNWCVAVLYGCGGGGGGFPPICDPPKGHGPIEESRSDGALDVLAEEVRSAPRGWIIQHDRWSYLLLEYKGKALFPSLASNDEGLYFVQHPVTNMGWLAPSRQGMAEVLGFLLSSIEGKEAKVHKNADVSLLPPLPRSTPVVSAGKWSVEWRAVPPLAPFFFPMGEYPRLMYRGKPATIQDLQAAGVEPEPAG